MNKGWLLVLALALVGCSQMVAPTPAPSATATANPAPTGPLASLTSLTTSDLQSAIAIAQAAQPPDTEAIQCYSWLSTNLTALQLPALTKPSGLVGGFELSRLALATAQSGLAPSLQQPLEMACGPLALNTLGGINWLLGRLGVAALAVPK